MVKILDIFAITANIIHCNSYLSGVKGWKIEETKKPRPAITDTKTNHTGFIHGDFTSSLSIQVNLGHIYLLFTNWIYIPIYNLLIKYTMYI